MIKQCTKCKKQKPFSAFGKHPGCKNGFSPICKKCKNTRNRKYYQIHKIEINKHRRKYSPRKYRKTLMGSLRDRFQSIKQRCNNPNNSAYKWYGGRGIKCLFKSSDEFINYILNELQVDLGGLTVDRIDNNGHYERNNIRLVTIAENQRNRRKKYSKS